jgi:uncharacterized protein (DUF58 family)
MSQTGLLYIFMGIIVSVIFINIVYSLKGVRALQIDDIKELITTENIPIETKILITNKSKKDINFIRMMCNHGLLFKLNEIEALSTKHVTPKIVFKNRGIYSLNKLRIETLNPFGLIKASKQIKCRGIIKVYPQLYYCAAPLAAGFEPMLGGHYKGYHTSLFGEDFAGVRPYVEGYPVKFIHWKASSKGQGIFVKEFNEEYSGKISFVFQNNDNRLGNDNILDWAVKAMGSLAFASLDIGHSIEITDFYGKQKFKASPFSNSTEVLEFLTQIKCDSSDETRQKINETIEELPKKSSLVFILTHPDEDSLNQIASYCRPERKVSIYLPFIEGNDYSCFLELTHRCFCYSREKVWEI